MIPLGSCTMKLNAAAELTPISWPRFAAMHPFAPKEQARGYAGAARARSDARRNHRLRRGVAPAHSGAQGEYAGLLAIRHYLAARGEGARDVCLIPASAHGTNPASAQMIKLRIVVVACDEHGNVDLGDLERKITEHRGRIAALMITYLPTHGVFEEAIVRICAQVHAAGGQVYMDGANMNALRRPAKPALIGADVRHINLHKTFCIPHGGGGPGMGPIAVAAHLADFLPEKKDPLWADAVRQRAHPADLVDVHPHDGRHGHPPGDRNGDPERELRRGAARALLPGALYRRARRVAHECILDLRKLKETCGVTAEDVAKRLMDYGFHAPTLSFPVADTLMVEPTEERVEGRARPVLRRHDCDSRRAGEDPLRTGTAPTTR